MKISHLHRQVFQRTVEWVIFGRNLMWFQDFTSERFKPWLLVGFYSWTLLWINAYGQMYNVHLQNAADPLRHFKTIILFPHSKTRNHKIELCHLAVLIEHLRRAAELVSLCSAWELGAEVSGEKTKRKPLRKNSPQKECAFFRAFPNHWPNWTFWGTGERFFMHRLVPIVQFIYHLGRFDVRSALMPLATATYCATPQHRLAPWLQAVIRGSQKQKDCRLMYFTTTMWDIWSTRIFKMFHQKR